MRSLVASIDESMIIDFPTTFKWMMSESESEI
jgi:hypothetical protein